MTVFLQIRFSRLAKWEKGAMLCFTLTSSLLGPLCPVPVTFRKSPAPTQTAVLWPEQSSGLNPRGQSQGYSHQRSALLAHLFLSVRVGISVKRRVSQSWARRLLCALIYFGCAGSSLQPVGSLLRSTGFLQLQHTGVLLLQQRDFSLRCGAWALECSGSEVVACGLSSCGILVP